MYNRTLVKAYGYIAANLMNAREGSSRVQRGTPYGDADAQEPFSQVFTVTADAPEGDLLHCSIIWARFNNQHPPMGLTAPQSRSTRLPKQSLAQTLSHHRCDR